MEAYSHVFDRDEKRALAHVMTQLLRRRAMLDFSAHAHYFVTCYRLECALLRQQAELIKAVLDDHVRNLFVCVCVCVCVCILMNREVKTQPLKLKTET